MAIAQLETDYFVALDVDFVTNQHGHAQFNELVKKYPNLTETLRTKTLLVLPAFESSRYKVTTKNETGHDVVTQQVKTLSAAPDFGHPPRV